MSPLGRNYCRWEPSDAFPFRKRTCLPFNTITCHATSHCNVHATYHSLHLPPRATLQRYQNASITCHQMSHWWCACHTSSHCNVPFPAPATQSHAPTLPGCFNHLPQNLTLVLRLPRNVTLQRPCNVHFPAPATQSHAPTLPECFNHLPPNVTLVVRLPHIVTLQRTLPCTSHPEPRSNATGMLQSPATKSQKWCCMQRTLPCTCHPGPRSNATRMLQSPATKCHTGGAPATHRHTATYPSLHQPPRATLQRYQDASIDCACHQMSHWCCASHTTSHCNVPFPAPATRWHAATGSVTCTSDPISRVQASQFHVYKRTRARLL